MKGAVILALLCLSTSVGPAEAATRKPKTESVDPLLRPNNDAMLRDLKNDGRPKVRGWRERRAPRTMRR
jgi:hypothetical protein